MDPRLAELAAWLSGVLGHTDFRLAPASADASFRRYFRVSTVRGTTIAKRNTEHGSGLGKHRCVVEGLFAWLFKFRRLRVRYEKRDDIHDAFLALGCILICWNRVETFC